jgi:hypothetical protein
VSSFVFAISLPVQMFIATSPSKNGDVALIYLIALMGASEVLRTSDFWSDRFSFSLKAAILPLIISFLIIVLCGTLEIIGSL